MDTTCVFSGPLKRQRGTAEIVAGCLKESGLEMPEPVILDGLKEIDADLIMGHIMRIRKDYPALDQLIGSYEKAETPEEKGSIFQEFFEKVMLLWMSNRLSGPGIETLAELKKRVVKALDTILASYEGQGNIIVFSSASPVSLITGHLLNLEDRQTLEITFGLNNCSATEFALTLRGPVLRKFNCTGHLPPEMVTLR